MKLQLLKCHGSANDFILIDELDGSLIQEQHRAHVSTELCNRHTSYGADGVLFLLASTTANADCVMRMFNPDGSEAQMCGNGLRCAARYYCEKKGSTKVKVQTAKAMLLCEKDKQRQGVEFYKVQIGPVSFAPESLPISSNQAIINQKIDQLDTSIRWYALSITNPHLVALVDSSQLEQTERLGTLANNLSLFPQGINCSLVQVINDTSIFVHTYERGAGITHACGTAMSASAFVAVYTGSCLAGQSINVYNRGAMVVCNALGKENEMVWKSGNATFVYQSQCEYDTTRGRLAGELSAFQALVANRE